MGQTLGSKGNQLVQIGRTYPSRVFQFAAAGETSATVILHAIGQAQRFIYIEDQYLVSMG